MDKTQRELLAAIDRTGRLVRWPDDKRLGQLVPVPVRLEGSTDVLVVPRELPGETKAPFVIHLLNCRYDGQKDGMMPQTKLTLCLRRDLVGDRKCRPVASARSDASCADRGSSSRVRRQRRCISSPDRPRGALQKTGIVVNPAR